jgi:hypothetical protein
MPSVFAELLGCEKVLVVFGRGVSVTWFWVMDKKSLSTIEVKVHSVGYKSACEQTRKSEKKMA